MCLIVIGFTSQSSNVSLGNVSLGKVGGEGVETKEGKNVFSFPLTFPVTPLSTLLLLPKRPFGSHRASFEYESCLVPQGTNGVFLYHILSQTDESHF